MDIDIDFYDRSKALDIFKHSIASRYENKELKPHNTGVYVTDIPHDLRDNVSTIDYITASERGYFKIDFLNVSVYEYVKSEEHLVQLLEKEPIWELLESDEFCDQLFQLNGYGGLMKQLKPTTIDQLAASIAMIRPGKRYLIGKDWTTIMGEVWTMNNIDGYAYKKSHAYGYAAAIIVNMNLLCEL